MGRKPADVPHHEGWLTPDERSAGARFKLPKRRREWLLGRWTAKVTLRRYFAQVSPEVLAPLTEQEPAILAAPDGAPEAFGAGARLPATISISHRGELCVCAIAAVDVPLGCDLELVEPRSTAFVRDYFTEQEQHLIAHIAGDARSLATALLWSAKESALKALRVGLRRDTRTVVVSLASPPPVVRSDRWQSLAVRDTTTQTIYPGHWRSLDHAVLTIVTSGKPSPVSPRALEA